MAVIVWEKDVTRKCHEGQWLGRKRVCKNEWAESGRGEIVVNKRWTAGLHMAF